MQEVQAKLASQGAAAAKENKLVTDANGTYLTGAGPSVYLPKTAGNYDIRLDKDGNKYITDCLEFSRWIKDFFPENAAPAPGQERGGHKLPVSVTAATITIRMRLRPNIAASLIKIKKHTRVRALCVRLLTRPGGSSAFQPNRRRDSRQASSDASWLVASVEPCSAQRTNLQNLFV